MIANSYNQWQPPRAKPLPRTAGYEVELLTPDEVTALSIVTRAAVRASGARLRELLLAAGQIRVGAGIAEDGTTIFRNDAKRPVLEQGHLTTEMIAATHPAELEGAERSAAGRGGGRDRGRN